jgi:LuxR family maltose regulon positive regulatory protein
VQHALAAADFERAADLIEQIAQIVMSQGKLFTIQRWLQSLPDEIIRSRLRLAVYQAWMLFSMAHLEAAENRLQEIEHTVSRETDAPFAGEIAALRAFFAYNHGDFPGCIKYTQQAIQILSQGDSFFHVFSTSLLGNAYRLNGDITLAVKVFQELSQHKREGQRITSATMALGNVVRLQVIQGNLCQAVQIYRQAFTEEKLQMDKATPAYGVAFIGMGEALCEWNDLEAAAHHLCNGVALCQRWPALVEFLVDGVVGLVRVLQAQQNIDRAFSFIQEIEQRTDQSSIFQWRLPRLAACKARLWLSPTSFNLAAAVKWTKNSGLTPNDDPPYVYEFEYLTLVRVLIATGKLDNALTLLSNLEQAAADAGRMSSVLECLVLRALAQEAHGDTNEALTTIDQALSLAELEGYIRIFVDEGEPMAALLRRRKAEGGRMKDYASQLLTAFNQTEAIPPSSSILHPLVDPLSDRELDVLRLLNTHLSGPEIAEELTVSVNTVKTHIKRIYSKLDAGNRHEAVERAKELNLL